MCPDGGQPTSDLGPWHHLSHYSSQDRAAEAYDLWKKGQYTDDTQKALLIAESLLQNNGFVASDLAQRFRIWARTAKDVGIQTRVVVDMTGYAQDPEGCSS
ncbi:MAG TPA: ADP-ribosylglycohydrolase family protein [Terriglobales bacterium]|nr:ADP-ribosylglycohydrolase family protein [Terriglobales bacterium]